MSAQIVDGRLGEAVEPARPGVALDLVVEARGVERLEPGAEAREVVGREVGDGLLKVFEWHGGGHIAQLRSLGCHGRTMPKACDSKLECRPQCRQIVLF